MLGGEDEAFDDVGEVRDPGRDVEGGIGDVGPFVNRVEEGGVHEGDAEPGEEVAFFGADETVYSSEEEVSTAGTIDARLDFRIDLAVCCKKVRTCCGCEG